ncbi:uncharacterized protein TNCV_2280991 [Trichonephila clavipes]|nr:uncharacterized protein TNCV_2280991 [Trichonephila clavipes]
MQTSVDMEKLNCVCKTMAKEEKPPLSIVKDPVETPLYVVFECCSVRWDFAPFQHIVGSEWSEIGLFLLSSHGCKVIYSQFGLAIHQNDHQARRRFVEWAQNEIAVVPDFHKRILFSDEAHFWLNGYVNKQNCRIWSEANPQVYVETPLHPEKLTVWCALWAGGIIGPSSKTMKATTLQSMVIGIEP